MIRSPVSFRSELLQRFVRQTGRPAKTLRAGIVPIEYQRNPALQESLPSLRVKIFLCDIAQRPGPVAFESRVKHSRYAPRPLKRPATAVAEGGAGDIRENPLNERRRHRTMFRRLCEVAPTRTLAASTRDRDKKHTRAMPIRFRLAVSARFRPNASRIARGVRRATVAELR